MEVKVDVSGITNVLEQVENITQNGEAMQFLTNEILRLADDYTPMDSGVLKNTAFVSGMGNEITYPTPYANYLYQGYLMVDPITGKGAFYDPKTNTYWSRPNTQKVVTSTPLHFKGEPQRGAKWIQRVIDDYSEELSNALNQYVKGRL